LMAWLIFDFPRSGCVVDIRFLFMLAPKTHRQKGG
jgi:hypothetical protein